MFSKVWQGIRLALCLSSKRLWESVGGDFSGLSPRAVSGVVRIDPIRFLAGCRKRQLNQAPSVLSLSMVSFEYVL